MPFTYKVKHERKMLAEILCLLKLEICLTILQPVYDQFHKYVQ